MEAMEVEGGEQQNKDYIDLATTTFLDSQELKQ